MFMLNSFTFPFSSWGDHFQLRVPSPNLPPILLIVKWSPCQSQTLRDDRPRFFASSRYVSAKWCLYFADLHRRQQTLMTYTSACNFLLFGWTCESSLLWAHLLRYILIQDLKSSLSLFWNIMDSVNILLWQLPMNIQCPLLHTRHGIWFPSNGASPPPLPSRMQSLRSELDFESSSVISRGLPGSGGSLPLTCL